MAWFISGKTKCPICNEVIYEGEEASFPSFVDRESPFAIFNDKTAHRKCFREHPLAQELKIAVNKIVDRHDEQWGWFVKYLDELLDKEDE